MSLRCTSLLSAGLLAAMVSPAQEAQPPAGAPPLIRSETRLVLVDAVVLDKKNQYVGDLTLKDFKVWEDNKEVQLKSFSFGADPSAPADNQHRYLVLFFDNASMDYGQQIQARQAAGKFIESNAGADRLMAVVNFGGTLQITQNFTADLDKLKQAVSGVKGSAVSTSASVGGPSLGGGSAAFGAASVLYAMMDMAKSLTGIPGRKSLILFTSGFATSSDVRSQANAVINACNKANVAIYPIDVRGLTPGTIGSPMGGRRGGGAILREPVGISPGMASRTGIALAAFPVLRIANFMLLDDQKGGGTTGGTPGGTTGGTRGAPGAPTGGGMTGSPRGGPTGSTPTGNTGSRGNTGTGNSGGGSNNNNVNNNVNNNNMNRNNPFNTPRMTMPSSVTTNQEIMYMLADNTGGFVIVNTNDLLGGMQKIGQEQKQYYVVGYTPPDSPEGTCHTLKVKVDRGGVNVRSRTGYCNVKSNDALAGSVVEKSLESRVSGATEGAIAAKMRAPFFYTGPNTARVAVAMEIPVDTVKFEKVKGKQHAVVNVLGIAYRADGTVAARFSDAVKLDFESQKEVQAFKAKPMHYENQFDVACGAYDLKVVFDSGNDAFGKLSAPLVINAYDGTAFAISGAAFSKEFFKTSDADTTLSALLMEGRAPLIAGDYQFTPTGLNRFKAAEPLALYAEVYEPLLAGETKPKLAVRVSFVDTKTKEVKNDSGNIDVANYIHTGSPVVPVALRLPLDKLQPGSYRMDLTALDSTGNFATRSADIEIQ